MQQLKLDNGTRPYRSVGMVDQFKDRFWGSKSYKSIERILASIMLGLISSCARVWKFAERCSAGRRALALILAGLLAGCSTIRYGGAPEPSFDVGKDLEQLAKEFEPASSISDFYKKPSVDARNKFITGRITLMNIRYIQFVRQLTTDRQLLDTATAMLVLGMNIAGASFAAAGTKTVLAALSAGVTGSKEAIDKNYFFDKTIPALVSQMNAERKKALYPLLVGIRTRSLDDYSFAQGVTDLNDYYLAGTFTGAIHGIQIDAAAKEEFADRKIATLTLAPITKEQVVTIAQLTDAIGKLVESDLPKIRNAITTIDKTVDPSNDFEAAKEQLQNFVRDAAANPEQIKTVVNAFKGAKILLEQ